MRKVNHKPYLNRMHLYYLLMIHLDVDKGDAATWIEGHREELTEHGLVDSDGATPKGDALVNKLTWQLTEETMYES